MSERLDRLIEKLKKEIITSKELTQQMNGSVKIIKRITGQIEKYHSKENIIIIRKPKEPKQPLKISYEISNRIIEMISRETNITKKEILSNSRLRPVAFARFTCMFLCKKEGMTLIEIGRVFHRDHSSVSYALEKVEDYNLIPKEYNKNQ